MKHNKKTNAIVIGGGITAQACALVLAEAGYSVNLIGNFKKTFGGIQLAPNGFSALKRLNLIDEISKKIIPLNSILIKNLDSNIRISEIKVRNDQKYASIPRNDLQNILLKKIHIQKNIIIKNDLVTSIIIDKNDYNIASAYTKNGSTYFSDFVIGADGSNGISRSFLTESSTPPNLKYVAMCSEVLSKKLPNILKSPISQLWLGNGCHLVSYPINKFKKINLVFCIENKNINHDWKEKYFGNNLVLKNLTRNIYSWKKVPIAQNHCLPVWQRGKLTLIGEAAHNINPHLAQGMGQNFLDLAILKESLSRLSLKNSLSFMAIQRSREVRKISQKSEISGRILRLRGFKSKLRNLLLNLSDDYFLNSWLYDVWDV